MSEILGRYPRNGRTARELAERTGMSPRTAQRWTSEPREIYLERADQRRTTIRALHAAEPTLTMRQLATRLGCSPATIHRALHAPENM